MEFKLQEVKSIPVVFNYEEMKEELAGYLKGYSNYLVNEDNLPLAKSDLAKLNKVKKALNDKKIEVKKLVLQDYEVFENQVKDLMSDIDNAIKSIKDQTDDFEKERIEEKKHKIMIIFNKWTDYHITIDKVYNPKWENKGYLLSDIEREIETFFTNIDNDLKIVETISSDEHDITMLREFYLQCFDLNKAIEQYKLAKQRNNALEQQKQSTSTITLDNSKTSVETAKKRVKLYSSVIQFTDSLENMKKLKKFLDEEHIEYTIESNMTYFKTIEVE